MTTFQTASKTTTDTRLRIRCQAVLMTHGRSSIATSPRIWASQCGRCNAGCARIWTRAWLGSNSDSVRGGQPAFLRPSHPRFSGESCKGQPAAAWSGRTGHTQNWPLSCIASMASRSVRVRGGPSVRAMACVPIARPIAILLSFTKVGFHSVRHAGRIQG